MKQIDKVDVCIATFRRPQLLSKVLDSIMQQYLGGIRMRIIVIDNDREESARPVVADFQTRYTTEIVYDLEPVQNIALARNRAIMHLEGDYFAFVDDDEIVSARWLRSLLTTIKELGVDVVFGPVHSVLPSDAPTWAHQVFDKPSMTTGHMLPYGGAGNVLLRRSTLQIPSNRFNVDFGLTGGEDTDFFYRLHLQGKKLAWCQEASVFEGIPDHRISLRWLRQRGFRSGQTYQRVVISRYSGFAKLCWFISKVGQLFAALPIAAFLRFVSYPHYVGLNVRIAATMGQLSRCFSGKNFEEYRL